MSRLTEPLAATRPLRALPSLLLLLLLSAFATPATAAPSMPAAIGAEDRQAIVDQILRALDDDYVFPEIARKMGEHLRLRLGSGAYDRLATLPEFAAQLTEDLQGVSHDLHLEVTWTPAGPQAAGQGPSPEELQARMAASLRRENYWFRDVKLLPGNVGYLKLDGFAPAGLAGSTATAAMGFHAGSDALIFDLRENDGGSPSMVQLLASYLLPGKPTHFSSFYVRKGDRTDQLWTQAWVPGTRLAETPVYVLTSHLTFSAAEDFAYSLKSLKRATMPIDRDASQPRY